MNLKTQPALNFSIAALADLMNRAFTGYIGGDAHFPPAAFAAFLATDGTSLALSQVVLQNDEPVGLALISRLGWASRLAGMGIVPEAAEKGVGTWFMPRLITEANARGDREFVLECFEQNTRGIRLYTRAGFRVVRRLLGYELQNPSGEETPALIEADPRQVASAVAQHAPANLPWQISANTVARIGPPNAAYQLGPALALLSPPTGARVGLRALIVPPAAQRQRHGTRLLRALFARHPGKTWVIPPICPEEYDGFFKKNGFTRQELNQVQMACKLGED